MALIVSQLIALPEIRSVRGLVGGTNVPDLRAKGGDVRIALHELGIGIDLGAKFHEFRRAFRGELGLLWVECPRQRRGREDAQSEDGNSCRKSLNRFHLITPWTSWTTF